MWRPQNLNTDRTLYIAVADEIEHDIRQGILKPGDKMPPQRSLAKIIGVNLTTISRAYKEAEKRGLISGAIGSGTFVSAKDGRGATLPDVQQAGGSLIELGLVGALKGFDFDLAPLLKAVAESGSLESLLDYTPSQGLPVHRQTAAAWVSRFGVRAEAEDMVICAGAMHAINCCLLGLFEPGDRIAVDALTFAGFKAAAQMARIKLEPVAMDEEGMIPENLESLCKRGGIKGIYLMPNMQNPTASSLSQHRKQAIADMIRHYGLILIEDDIYSFTSNHPTSLTSLVPEQGIYISGISKVFFPGLRIAFAAVPERYRLAFTQAVVNTIWMAPPLNAELICRCIRSGMTEEIIRNKRKIITQRMAIAQSALAGFTVQSAANGLFLWLHLPSDWNCADFENVARSRGVSVISAYKFHVGNTLPPNGVRISVSSVRSDEELKRGLTILVGILKDPSLGQMPVM